LTDEQRAEMKAYMSLLQNVFVNAVVCLCASARRVLCFVIAGVNKIVMHTCCIIVDESKLGSSDDAVLQ